MQPAQRFTDLSRGGSWEYITYPGEADGSDFGPDGSPSGQKYVALVPAGSDVTVSAGQAATDVGIPGALIRLYKTTSASGSPSYRYDGTYRQDSETRDLYLLRLPTGELLDTPAKVLPGIWSLNTEIKSRFIVGGKTQGVYTLTVDAAEIIETILGSKAVWITRISIESRGSGGGERLQTSRQWFDPAIGSYLQAMSRDAKRVLNDLTLVEILDDEKIKSYTVNP
jgi:hypothetical protein